MSKKATLKQAIKDLADQLPDNILSPEITELTELDILKIMATKFIHSLTEEDYERVTIKQRGKGFEKYGRHLENVGFEEKNWIEMAKEEAIDLFQYLKKQEAKENYNKFKIK